MSASSSAASQGRLGRARRTGPGRRILGGVASGLADALDLDPLVARVACAYLSLFGGLGVLAYLVAWAAMPGPHQQPPALQRWFGVHERGPVVGGALLVAVGLSTVVVQLPLGRSLSLPLVLVATGVLLVRRPGHGRPSDPDRPASRLRGRDTGSNYSGKEI